MAILVVVVRFACLKCDFPFFGWWYGLQDGLIGYISYGEVRACARGLHVAW